MELTFYYFAVGILSNLILIFMRITMKSARFSELLYVYDAPDALCMMACFLFAWSIFIAYFLGKPFFNWMVGK